MRAPDQREFQFTDEDFLYIVEMVHKITGIKLASHKRNMVYGRISRRLRELHINSFHEYCNFVETDKSGEELVNFVNAITTNLTGFFRESHHFDHLKEHLQAKAKNTTGSRKLRIWSSASSSGQEPYSIAMTLSDAISNLKQWDAKILATDIDTNMIETCQRGVYAPESAEKIPENYRKRFTQQEKRGEGDYSMGDDIRKLISFKPLNLLHDWPMKGPFDIIFCRNVVIYFDKETQIKLFDRMADLLAPDGVIYIGHSESLFNVSKRFELIAQTTYRKIN